MAFRVGVQSPQMPFSDLVALGILPAVVWVSRAYVARSTSKSASKLRVAWSARTKQELVEGAQSWTTYGLLIFLVVLFAVVTWTWVKRSDALQTILIPSHWKRSIFHGIILGLALVGILLILRRHFPEAKKFTLLVLAGIASPPLVRILALLLVIFTQELWRVVCLKALMGDGVSGPQALLATSIAYGSAYLPWGPLVADSEGIVGAALGGLFLWSGSFLVPFAAHITLGAQVLLYAVAAAPDAEAGDIHRRPFARCPACGATLSLRQVNVNINEAFFCPSCHTRITVSDRRRAFLRWGFVFVFIALLIGVFDVLPGAIRGNQYWIALALTFCAGVGLWSFLQIIFPPKLECGDPDFVRLNLGDREARPHEEKTHEPDEPDSK